MSSDSDESEPLEPSWHDNSVYGFQLVLGDHERGDWRSELMLDIDHIVEWVCAPGGRPRFRIAPATLVFHDVTDLQIAIDCGDTSGQVALHALSIDRVARARIRDQKVCFDRPYYRWRIELNWPKGGSIVFAASGFTQTLRAEPVLQDEQQLPAAMRV
jgi:hypothetical protein